MGDQRKTLGTWVTLTEATSWLAFGERRQARDVIDAAVAHQKTWHAPNVARLVSTLEALFGQGATGAPDDARKIADQLKMEMQVADDAGLLAAARAELERWRREYKSIARAQNALLEEGRADRIHFLGRPIFRGEHDDHPARSRLRRGVPVEFLLDVDASGIEYGFDKIEIHRPFDIWLQDHVSAIVGRRDPSPVGFIDVQCKSAELGGLVAEHAPAAVRGAPAPRPASVQLAMPQQSQGVTPVAPAPAQHVQQDQPAPPPALKRTRSRDRYMSHLVDTIENHEAEHGPGSFMRLPEKARHSIAIEGVERLTDRRVKFPGSREGLNATIKAAMARIADKCRQGK